MSHTEMNATTTTETAYDLLCSCDTSGALYASGPQVIGSYRSLSDARRGAAARLQSAPAVGPGCYLIHSEEDEFQPVFADINHLYGTTPFPGC